VELKAPTSCSDGIVIARSHRASRDARLSTGYGDVAIQSLRARYVPLDCWCGRVRRETGRRYEVKVLFGEGVANHTDPESCAATREGRSEALTGDSVGQPLSGEN
jgi:hypothetical protein